MEKENVTYAQEEKQSVETNPKVILMLKSADRTLKQLISMLTGIGENMLVMNEKVINLKEVETIHKRFQN